MKTYGVKIPIACHAYVEVEAENEEEAVTKAMQSDFGLNDVEEWEALERFNQGNVCYCPLPWEVEAQEM